MKKYLILLLGSITLISGMFSIVYANITPSSDGVGINLNVSDPSASHFDVKKLLGLKSMGNDSETGVLLFFQDIILGATMFIGTIVSIALIISGLMFVFSSVDSGLKTKAKKGMINAIIGLILVSTSYLIIRIIQYLAAGGR